MKQTIVTALLTAVYFLIVWRTAVRRGGQRLLPWAAAILTQGISAGLSGRLTGAFGSSAAAWAVLAVGNLAVIAALNLLSAPKAEAEPVSSFEAEMTQFVLDDELSPALRESPSESVSDAQDAEQTAEAAVPAEETAEDGMMFEMIRKLVEGGQQEDAVRYLRMVAFYEKDPQIAQKAKQLLAQLQS